MELDKNELEGMLEKAADKAVTKSQEHTDRSISALEGRLDRKIDESADRVLAESQERTERYLGALKEDFDHKLDVVLEAVQPIADIQERLTNVEATVNDMAPKVDATFEKVGEMAVDIETTKEAVQDINQRLQKVEVRG